jgi:malate dehydrogenase (oxaloacetate-decarboxylating)(NADP+)
MPDNKTKLHLRKLTDQDALDFHQEGQPGKIAISPTKPLTTQRDLSLAYSPGVAAPCREIHADPNKAYNYTAKGNFVAVISNGTAVLGLGDLGALASKPVMEGKSVLFKRFADIDSVDIEVDTKDAEKFINCVKYLAPSWGGINLEDIKAPECFIIEKRLKKEMNIPVFHDDQHGTAVITLAGLINAAHIAKKKFSDLVVVVNGAGSAGIACLDLILSYGVKPENCFLCDRSGIIYKGRKKAMNEWKEKYAVETNKRSLMDAMTGADVFLGLSAKDAVSKEMVKAMAPNPVIFAMANPDPEIRPEDAKSVRSDAIIATGRSDYQNQVNNVMGFPYIFRGALDVHATTINEEMKIACAEALAQLARKPIPEEVAAAYSGKKMQYGPDYIIPVPFDPRLIHTIPVAVAKAAIKTKVARKKITNWKAYEQELAARLNPTANTLNLIFGNIRNEPKNIIFAEGENRNIVAAAKVWQESSYGNVTILSRDDSQKTVLDHCKELNIDTKKVNIININKSEKTKKYALHLYKKLQRKGVSEKECLKMLTDDNNIYAACNVDLGDSDIMITGANNSYQDSLEDIQKVIETEPDKKLFGYSAILSNNKTVYIADTALTELSSSEELAETAINLANQVKKMGHTPRVALVSFSNFGSQLRKESKRIRAAKEILDKKKVDFEYDGEMSPDVALNEDLLKLYPFCNLTEPANILIMPGLHSAIISSKLIQEMGGSTVIGPILTGLTKSAQIVPAKSSTTDIINITAIAAQQLQQKNKNVKK